jgi:hypothetical protein
MEAREFLPEKNRETDGVSESLSGISLPPPLSLKVARCQTYCGRTRTPLVSLDAKIPYLVTPDRKQIVLLTDNSRHSPRLNVPQPPI